MAAFPTASLCSIAACVLLAACLRSPAAAATMRVYRCVDGSGAVAWQDRPCAAGQLQQQRRLQRPAREERADADDPPEPPAAVAAPDPARERAPQPPAARSVADPPPLWECMRYDRSVYESTDGIPARQWVPSWVLGDVQAPLPTPSSAPTADAVRGPGPPRLPPHLGLALEQGRWVEDRCRQLSRQESCLRHDARRDALRRQWRLAQPSEQARIRPQERALSAMLRAACGR